MARISPKTDSNLDKVVFCTASEIRARNRKGTKTVGVTSHSKITNKTHHRAASQVFDFLI